MAVILICILIAAVLFLTIALITWRQDLDPAARAELLWQKFFLKPVRIALNIIAIPLWAYLNLRSWLKFKFRKH